MRKGLVVTLGVLALVLVVSPGFAVAPIISCVPDIVVSDFEDSQTVDNNLFVFTDALDLDGHVTDADTTDTSLLRWSFIQSSGPAIEINGVATNTSGNVVSPGTFDIRAVSNLIDVRNVDWSPVGGALPHAAPATSPETSMIELYVSDGTNTGSQTVSIISVDESAAGPGDRLVPKTESTYDFAANQQGWTWFASTDPGFVAAGNQWAAGSLQMTETTALPTEVVYGAWESPKNPAVAENPRFGSILRARFAMRSSVDGMTCPGIRFRAPTTKVMDAGGGTWIPDFLSQDLNSDLTVNYFTPDIAYVAGREPGIAGKDYVVLSYPQQIDSLMASSTITFVSADLLDLDQSYSNDAGTIYIDQVDIDCMDRPAAGAGTAVPALSFTDFTGWAANVGPIAGGAHVAPVFTLSATQLQLACAPGTQFYDAAAISPAVALESGRYYRAIFTVSSTAPPPGGSGDFGPTFRLGFGSSQFSFSSDKNLSGGGLLSAISTTQEPYEVWMVAPPMATGVTQTEPLFVRFQSWLLSSNTGFPFNANVSGTIYCHGVSVDSFDPPATGP